MSKKVLIVDDDPVSVALMDSRLTKAGYNVIIARNGEQGLARLRAEKPDALVLDIEMPEMNGYTFIIEMKKDEAVKNTPLVVQTSHEENRALFARRGIFNYLVKPINFDVLLLKLKELVGE